MSGLYVDAPLSFKEFLMREPLPLATVFREVFTFLKGRKDTVLVGAQAVNAYAEPERMTHDVDMVSTAGDDLAQALCDHLAKTFTIAVRKREVARGLGIRIYQIQKTKNRHLIDIRKVEELPTHRSMGGVQIVTPGKLVAMKVKCFAEREHEEKGITDRLDIHRLLNKFPRLRTDGSVELLLHAENKRAVEMWLRLREERVERGDDDAW